jgi:hypothetical protein
VDTLVNPDLIWLDIMISEKDTKDRISLEVLENRMAKKLEELGIDLQEQLTLLDLASNFKHYWLKQKDVMKQKRYRLKVYNGLTAGNVLVALESVGISNVNLFKTEYSGMEVLKMKLKSKAVAKAKLQADYLVSALDQKVSGALFISDKYFKSRYEYGAMDEMVVTYNTKGNEEPAPIAIDFKPIKIESEVLVRFVIE